METIRARPYAAGDLARMAAFLMASRAADPAGDYDYAGDLYWSFRLLAEPERNVRLWEQGRRLVGLARVDPSDGSALPQVDPAHAGTGLEDELLDWCLARLGEVRRATGAPAEVSLQARDADPRRVAWLERRGFRREGSPFRESVRRLDEPIPEPVLPPGYRLRHYAGEPDLLAYVDMHRDAWSRPGRPSSYTVEAHRRVVASPGYLAELTPVAVAPDGTLAAYCIGWLDPVNRLAEIEPLGTRPAHRQRGLARAVVLEGLRRMRACGAASAVVFSVTDDDRAWRVYQACGFRAVGLVHTYARAL